MLSPTVPNPTQFNFAPGTVVSSSQVNSNFYGIETQIFALLAGLNGCGWIPSATIGSVTTNPPLSAALGSCTANSGAGVNLTLSLSGTVPAANLPATVGYTATGFPASALVGPILATNGTATGGVPHSVVGAVTLPNATGVAVNLSGLAIYSAAGTFSCTPAVLSAVFVQVSVYNTGGASAGSQFVFYQSSGSTLSVAFHCTGY